MSTKLNKRQRSVSPQYAGSGRTALEQDARLARVKR